MLFAGGYRVELEEDGVGEVIKSDGTVYEVDLINGTGCTCPDAQKHNGGTYSGRCKHQWWLAQLSICTLCGWPMHLNGEHFECRNRKCRASRMLSLVKEERAARRNGHE